MPSISNSSLAEGNDESENDNTILAGRSEVDPKALPSNEDQSSDVEAGETKNTLSAGESPMDPQNVAGNENRCLDNEIDETSNEDKSPAEETTADHETERIPAVKIADKMETRDNGLAGTNAVDYKVSPKNRDQSSDKGTYRINDLC